LKTTTLGISSPGGRSLIESVVDTKVEKSFPKGHRRPKALKIIIIDVNKQ
jgi:hypothetical protein